MLLSVIELRSAELSVVGMRLTTMTDDDVCSTDSVEIREVYREAADPPIAGGRWEVLADDTVRYVRPAGEIVRPAVVSASMLRSSPTWRRVT